MPEAVSSLPAAVIAKLSVPRYRAFAVYWYVEELIFFTFPRLGFLETSELLMVPDNLSGNWQLSLGARAMWAVDFSPQLASVADIEQSDAASAKDAGPTQRAPRTIERVATDKAFMRWFSVLAGPQMQPQ